MNRKQDKRNLNTKVELANAFKELSKKKPMVKTEEEIEETRQELERLEKVLEQKKQRKQHENK